MRHASGERLFVPEPNDLNQYAHAAWVAEEAFRGSLMGSGVAERDVPLVRQVLLPHG
jgi:hypothetical protein